MNPYGDDMIVDQVIGSAYQVVKYVASNMGTLIELSDFIQFVSKEDLLELIEAIPELTELHAHLTELLTIHANLAELLALEVNLPMLTVIYDMLPELQEIYDNLPAILDSSLSVAASREAIVRSYSEAGFPMDKTESFEVGGTITTAKETLLYEQNGVGYSWGGALPKVVPADSTPATTGGIGPTAWIDQSTKLLRQQLTTFSGNLTPNPEWADVPSNSDSDLGGAGGPLNAQADALTARTELLKLDKQTLISNYANLRSYERGGETSFYVTGVVGIAKPEGIVGHFLYDPTDTTSPDNGGTTIVGVGGERYKRQFSGGLNPQWFGAVSDYYLANGITVNPTPTDSTAALQKAIDALNGNGVIDLNGFYYTTGSLNNGGILTINGDLTSNRGYDFTTKTGKHYQNGVKTSAAAMFNPDFRNAVFNITGVSLFGDGTAYNNGTNKMFNTAGKVFETDYFLVNIKYCNIQFFGDLAIDGTLGTWLWDITGNMISNNNGLAVYLNQPNNTKVDWNMFDTRNKGDLKVYRGTVLSHRNNLHNFDPSTKEYCVWFQRSNNFVSELNYFEQFGTTETVNGGKNTYPYILEIDHFERLKMRAIRNNFCQLNTAGGGLARFITLRKTDGQDFTTTANVDIVGNNLSPVPPYFMYYEPPVASTTALILNGVSARNDLSLLLASASGRIFDSNRLLRTTGDGMESVYITTLTSPANNARITQSNCTEPLADASNFFTSATAWRLDPGVSGEILITYQWTSAVAANFTVNFEIVGNVFATTEVRTCTGTAGAGTFSIAKSLWGNKSLDFGFVLKGGATPLCDSFKAQIIVK